MKKLLTTILFISYFIASSGATIHVHYCMGKAVEIGLSKKADDEKCPGCGMKDKKGCCNDKETRIKISDDHQHSIADIQISSPIIYLYQPALTADFNSLEKSRNLVLIPEYNPILQTTSLSLFNCVLLI